MGYTTINIKPSNNVKKHKRKPLFSIRKEYNDNMVTYHITFINIKGVVMQYLKDYFENFRGIIHENSPRIFVTELIYIIIGWSFVFINEIFKLHISLAKLSVVDFGLTFLFVLAAELFVFFRTGFKSPIITNIFIAMLIPFLITLSLFIIN